MFSSHVCSLFHIRHPISLYRTDYIQNVIQITKPFTALFHLSRCCLSLPRYKYSLLHHNLNTLNLLTPNVNYSGRTAPLNSKVAFYIFIQQI